MKCLCFLVFFSLLWESTFPIFWELYGFLLHPKFLRNPLLWSACFFPYFSLIIGIHLSHVLGIVWISASSKIFKKPINLKCLCFPILFPYYGNPLFPCVGNCMDFCFKQKIPETLNFEMFVFSHIFSLLWEFTFLIFCELYVLMQHMKYVRNLQLWNVFVFPYVSFTMRIQLFLMFSELYRFLFHAK